MLCPLPAETTLQHRFNWCMLRLHLFSLPIIHAGLICYLYAFHWRYWFLSSKWKLQLLFFILYVHGRNRKLSDLGFLSYTSMVSNPIWWKTNQLQMPYYVSDRKMKLPDLRFLSFTNFRRTFSFPALKSLIFSTEGYPHSDFSFRVQLSCPEELDIFYLTTSSRSVFSFSAFSDPVLKDLTSST